MAEGLYLRSANLFRAQPLATALGAATFGTLVSDSGSFSCLTLELPWRENLPNESCIPPALYLVTFRWSARHGRMCYHVEGVPGRDAIELDIANIPSELKGCIAVGLGLGVFAGEDGITQSGLAMARLELDMAQAPFQLTIR